MRANRSRFRALDPHAAGRTCTVQITEEVSDAQPARADLARRPPGGLTARLGPGLVTGAADDDPSGIATYSQVGAQFGYAMGWTLPFSFPLMFAVQEACGRIGFATGQGIAANLRALYPGWVVRGVILLLLLANTCNLGADLAAMGDGVRLLAGGPPMLWAGLLGFLCFALPAWLDWRRYSNLLKWLTLTLLAYVAVLCVVNVPWGEAIRGALVPTLPGGREGLLALVAILGTTISPYLFFWQASQEVVERRENGPKRMPASRLLRGLRRIRFDTLVGMAASNLVALCIMVAAAATLHAAGKTDIATAADAAEALRPAAGAMAELVFALGIVGTGLLAVPALSASTAYGLAEAFRWQHGLDRTPGQAPRFYVAKGLITLAGFSLGFLGLDPVKALVWSSVLNGLLAPPLMVLILRIATRPELMRGAVLPTGLRVGVWIAAAALGAAALALVISWVV